MAHQEVLSKKLFRELLLTVVITLFAGVVGLLTFLIWDGAYIIAGIFILFLVLDVLYGSGDEDLDW